MPLTQLVIMLLSAVVVTPPAVRLIPHARQSPTFDRLLMGGTFAVAFLGAWLALGVLGAPFTDYILDSVPWLAILLGSIGGALALNLLLWILDLLERPAEDGDDASGK